MNLGACTIKEELVKYTTKLSATLYIQAPLRKQLRDIAYVILRVRQEIKDTLFSDRRY
ncbi:hypothetical protein [Nostoc commune]|uniref:hypothetical protein n=1 Tax=Nostoc commune TaxID=1178 RepID=UPI002074910B|nr:hypothetical protein [Nostoc commune]